MPDNTLEPGTISAAALLTVLPHVSKEAARPILGGVYLRSDGVAVGTNGRTLGAHRNAHTVPGDIILEATKDLERLAKKAAKLDLALTVTVAGDVATVTGFRESLGVAIIDGPFPLIAQIFPTEVESVTAIAVDSKLLALFPGKVNLTFSGPSRAITVTLQTSNRDSNPDFVGLIMPYRLTDVPDVWIVPPKAEAA